jgi:hypothetical protein
MRLSRDHHDALEEYSDNLMRRAHRGAFIALAIYGLALSYLCWRLA